MTRNAVGFNGQSSLLEGLKGTPSYGKAMAAQAQLDFSGDMANKQSASKQNQENMMRQQQKNSQNANRASKSQAYNQGKKDNRMGQAQNIAQAKSTFTGLQRKDHVAKQNTILNGMLSDS